MAINNLEVPEIFSTLVPGIYENDTKNASESVMDLEKT